MALVSGNFELQIGQGQFTDSEIIVMLGENGTGKTTFIRILAGKLQTDEGGINDCKNINLVYIYMDFYMCILYKHRIHVVANIFALDVFAFSWK